MTTRKPRREVFAELVLLASPRAINERDDGESLTIRFDSIADLRSWLTAAGLDTPDTLVGTERAYTDNDGRPRRHLNAYPTWHGWEIYAHADEPDDPPAELDARYAADLAELVATGTWEG